MSLKEKRELWESELEERLVVVDPDQNVLVLLEKSKGEYCLYRYFTIAGKWEVSVDYDGGDLIYALELISDGFKEKLTKLTQYDFLVKLE